MLPRLAPELIEALILAELDRAALGHNTFTPDALALIVRSGEGLLRPTKNLGVASLIEAVRDQIRTVDLKTGQPRANSTPLEDGARQRGDCAAMSTANGESNGCPCGAVRRTKTVTNPSDQKQPRPWTRDQIREARMAELAPLLEKRGHTLAETGSGNCLVPAFPGLIVKAGYWRWPNET